MTIINTGSVLFSDNFSQDTQVNPGVWNYVPFAAVNNPAFLGQTETNQNLPSIVDGDADLTIDTYNPIPPGTGNSFAGTAIYTTQTFQPGATGIVFTVTAKPDQPQPGLVAGIFPYLLMNSANSDHNEIDTELVSNDPTNLSVNTYDDQPDGVGNPQTVSLPAGVSLTQLNTYQMVWTNSQITWYVDGTQVASTTTNLPTGGMPLYLNFWVPGNGPNGWDYAYDPALLPVNSSQANTRFNFSVASVQVAQLDVLSGLTVARQIELIYIAYFNRAADSPGLAFWSGQITAAENEGQSAATALNSVANSFAPQPETEALYPSLDPYLTSSPPPLNTTSGIAAVTTFVDAVYMNLFNRAADTAGQNYWVGQIVNGSIGPGAAALAIANGAIGTDAIALENKITASSAGAALPATVGDPLTIAVSGSVIDPGMGSFAIQFLPGTSDDTLVLHINGVDVVSGFNPGSDVLDLRSLLSEANVNLNDNIARLSNYLTVTDQGSNALVNFDPTGHAAGGTVAVLQGLGSTGTNLDSLIAQGAIRIA
jgi:hypothetical protein